MSVWNVVHFWVRIYFFAIYKFKNVLIFYYQRRLLSIMIFNNNFIILTLNIDLSTDQNQTAKRNVQYFEGSDLKMDGN